MTNKKNTLSVKAKKGLKVPFELSNSEFIDDNKWVDVPNYLYYRRAIKAGDLIVKPAKTTGGKDGQ